MTGPFRPPWVPALPFLLSSLLSLSTVGSGPGWQDSGLYLMGVKELGVLYPPGFVLYLLLCKAWTLLFAFLDFTLAVHLFSSACAASAAAVLALAARDWLRGGAGPFRTEGADPGERADWAAAGAGCVAACGYTFWASGLIAKGYALLYLVLALILWRMVRAAQGGRPGDFTRVALLAGLAWAVHPSAALLVPAFILFAAAHRRTLGIVGLLWRAGLAVLCAVGPSIVLLPILTARDPWLKMGDPRSAQEFLDYLLGRRFTGLPGVFGFSASRFASFGRYLWEEFLGVGLILVAAGLARLAILNRRLLAGLAAWIVPFALGTLLFKIEGQHDFWLVTVWLPLHLVAGLGLSSLAARAGPHGRLLVGGAAAVAVAWAAFVNGPLLNQRGYALPELFARAHLSNLDPGAIVLLDTDDPIALCGYLQRVRGERADLVLVRTPFLNYGDRGAESWYDRALSKAHPFLRPADYAGFARRFPRADADEVRKGAFLATNAATGRPVFLQQALPQAFLPEGYALAPAGGLWKFEAGRGDRIEPRYWRLPLEPEDVRRSYRRERGQAVTFHKGRIEVEPEGYERRLLLFLLAARANQADVHLNLKDYARAAAAYESLMELDPQPRRDAETLFALALAYRGMGRDEKAEAALRETLKHSASPSHTAEALLTLGQIYRTRGDAAGAEECFRRALETPDLDPAERSRLEGRIR